MSPAHRAPARSAPPAGGLVWPSWLTAYAAAIALFHLWFNTIGTLPSLWLNSLHYGLLGSLIALAAWHGTRRQAPAPAMAVGRGPTPQHRLPGGSGRAGATVLETRVAPAAHAASRLSAPLALILAMVALGTGVYLLVAEEALHARGEVMIWSDRLAASLAVISALVLCRRTSGWVIPVLVIVGIGYVTLFGRYLDGVLHFRGLSVERILYRFYFTGEGLFGTIATISATFVFMFILFSAFLLASGAGDIIIRLARVATGRVPGGAGYVAILSSALTGTITGSAVANAVSTGSITIPLMTRAGFRPTFAAAIETAASTGGQIMPPVMGAGAFVMAQYTGIPYATIAAASLLPAVLYFASLSLYIFFETRRQRLAASEEAAETFGRVLGDGLPFVVPVGVLLALLVAGFSPSYAAGGGIVAVVAASWLTRRHQMGWREVWGALALGSRNAASTALLLVATGLVIGTLNMTGLGVAFSQLVLNWSGGQLWAALLLAAAASLVLGMGLPVTAAYVMLAAVAVPALQELGVALLAAHLIIFWFSQDSNVTPPVCLAAFAAAGIAGSPPMATGLQAWKMAKALYIVPVLFAYTALLDGSWPERLAIAGTAALGLAALTAALARHLIAPLTAPQTTGLLVAALALLWPDHGVNAAGAIGLAAVAWRNARA